MNKRVTLLGIAIAASIGFSTQAAASNFSYTYLEISAGAVRFNDEIRLPTNFGSEVYKGIAGATLAGSYQFTDVFYVLLASSYLENSGDNTELSVSQSLLGLGSAFAVGSDTDINFGIGVASAEAEACFTNFCVKDKETGLGLRAGVRHKLTDALEISTVVGHTRFSDVGDSTSINASIAWWFNNSSSVSLGIGVNDDSDTSMSVGYRYTFGRR